LKIIETMNLENAIAAIIRKLYKKI
jgi:hypothetical protein